LYWKLKSFLTIVYLKRDLRQTCHVDKRAFVPEIKIVSDNRLSEKRPAANVPRRRPRSRTAAGRLAGGASEAATAATWMTEAGRASEAATAATWMTEARRAHCRPRSLFKNDSKRFESPVQMLVCLRGTFVRSGPPGKIFSHQKIYL
jgi:hypothetical protein